MKHLSSILLSIGVILSVVAIILPQWSVLEAGTDRNAPVYSQHSGLWEFCAKTSKSGQPFNCMAYTDGKNKPKDILVSQILSIVGTVGLAVGAVMCMMMKPRYSKLAAGLGVACLTAVLIVYGVVTQGQLGRSFEPEPKAGEPALTTNKVGASFWLELSAAVVGLIGLFVPAAKK